MRFTTGKYLLLLMLILIGTFLYFSDINKAKECQYNFQIIEENMMDTCDVPINQYYEEMRINKSFCPEGKDYIRKVSICQDYLKKTSIQLVLAFIFYNLLIGITYVVLDEKKK